MEQYKTAFMAFPLEGSLERDQFTIASGLVHHKITLYTRIPVKKFWMFFVDIFRRGSYKNHRKQP